MADWYIVVGVGRGPRPRGPWRSLDEAREAIARWFRRHGQHAGTYWAAGSCRLTGPYRTRRQALEASIASHGPVVSHI